MIAGAPIHRAAARRANRRNVANLVRDRLNDDDTLGGRLGLTAFEAIEVAGRAWAFSSRASPLEKGRQDVPMDKDRAALVDRV